MQTPIRKPNPQARSNAECHTDAHAASRAPHRHHAATCHRGSSSTGCRRISPIGACPARRTRSPGSSPHLAFWQDWFRGRCEGTAGPMPASAALGWVAPDGGRWDAVGLGFLEGVDRLVTLGTASDSGRRIDPPIEFPPLGTTRSATCSCTSARTTRTTSARWCCCGSCSGRGHRQPAAGPGEPFHPRFVPFASSAAGRTPIATIRSERSDGSRTALRVRRRRARYGTRAAAQGGRADHARAEGVRRPAAARRARAAGRRQGRDLRGRTSRTCSAPARRPLAWAAVSHRTRQLFPCV